MNRFVDSPRISRRSLPAGLWLLDEARSGEPTQESGYAEALQSDFV